MSVGIYPNLLDDQARFILGDCRARAIFVQGKEDFERMLPMLGEFDSLEHIIVWDHEPEPGGGPGGAGSPGRVPPAAGPRSQLQMYCWTGHCQANQSRSSAANEYPTKATASMSPCATISGHSRPVRIHT